MIKLTKILLGGTIGLVTLVGCQQAPPPSEEVSQEPTEKEAVVEESFEEGDTGTLTSEPEASTESEEEPLDDSQ